MHEKYKPSEEEVQKAENTIKELGLEERNQAEQDAFEAGQKFNKQEVEKLTLDEILANVDFSDHTKRLIEENQFGKWVAKDGFLSPKSSVDKEALLEFIEKCPKAIEIDVFEVCKVTSSIDEDVMKALFNKFPKAILKGSSRAFKILEGKPGITMMMQGKLDISCPND